MIHKKVFCSQYHEHFGEEPFSFNLIFFFYRNCIVSLSFSYTLISKIWFPKFGNLNYQNSQIYNTFNFYILLIESYITQYSIKSFTFGSVFFINFYYLYGLH